MGRRKPMAKAETVLVDVVYEDGTLTSHRKITTTLLDGFDDDTILHTEIEAQDRLIAERSGRARGPIKSITRLK